MPETSEIRGTLAEVAHASRGLAEELEQLLPSLLGVLRPQPPALRLIEGGDNDG